VGDLNRLAEMVERAGAATPAPPGFEDVTDVTARVRTKAALLACAPELIAELQAWRSVDGNCCQPRSTRELEAGTWDAKRALDTKLAELFSE
jgi:hypothetical protein